MPYKKPVVEKIFYSITEVADMLGVSASMIRFWDKEFSTLKPHKNNKGNRQFTPADIEHLRLIHHLVKERGMTLKGADSLLKQNSQGAARSFEAVQKLLQIKQQLIEIRDEMRQE